MKLTTNNTSGSLLNTFEKASSHANHVFDDFKDKPNKASTNISNYFPSESVSNKNYEPPMQHSAPTKQTTVSYGEIDNDITSIEFMYSPLSDQQKFFLKSVVEFSQKLFSSTKNEYLVKNNQIYSNNTYKEIFDHFIEKLKYIKFNLEETISGRLKQFFIDFNKNDKRDYFYVTGINNDKLCIKNFPNGVVESVDVNNITAYKDAIESSVIMKSNF